jgi:hypothetical protein
MLRTRFPNNKDIQIQTSFHLFGTIKGTHTKLPMPTKMPPNGLDVKAVLHFCSDTTIWYQFNVYIDIMKFVHYVSNNLKKLSFDILDSVSNN